MSARSILLMPNILIIAIFISGLSGLVAQVVLLRELLVSFYGNELTLGIILANWVMFEALGALSIGRLIERIKNKIGLFIILEIIFSLSLPFCLYLARVFKYPFGIAAGEGVGLYTIFVVSFLVNLSVSFTHGASFSAACKIYAYSFKEKVLAIGRLYSWETIGTVCGGIILTYFFIPRLNSFQIILILAIANLIICLFITRYLLKQKLPYFIFSLLALIIFLFLIPFGDNIHRFSINQQWPQTEVLDYRNSVYGNIVVTQREKQLNFFYNGIPIITAPSPDITFIEEFGHLPLLFHRQPKDVLILSGGCGGLINEIRKHAVEKIDYAELDPMLIEMLKEYPTDLTANELSDKRVKVINLDGRFFLKTTASKYDVILLGISQPLDLSVNRIFTQEFFSLAKKRLRDGGILTLFLPGSLTNISPELRDLNFCILNGLKKTFAYQRVIPGDYNLLLASDTEDIARVGASLIAQKLKQQNIKTEILLPAYLNYRLDPYWLEWFNLSSRLATSKVNQDLWPYAVFEMLVFFNQEFSPGLARIFRFLKGLDLKVVSISVFFITCLAWLIFYRKKEAFAKFSLAYSIATTGFFGMLSNLVLIFSFQVYYGYLYYKIGILIAVFMLGIALGSITMTGLTNKIKNAALLFIKLEILVVIFTYLMALILSDWISKIPNADWVFMCLFLISGMLLGWEFPLASKIYLKEKDLTGKVAGLLYSSDLLGGWVAGIFGGVLFLPVLGLFNTCMVIVIAKLSSLFLILASKRQYL